MDLRLVILLELPDEPYVGIAESIDILVVIANGQNGKLLVLVIECTASNSADHLILALVNVLVFVHQDVAETGKQSLANLIRFETRRNLFTAQEFCGVLDQNIEVDVAS